MRVLVVMVEVVVEMVVEVVVILVVSVVECLPSSVFLVVMAVSG